MGHQGVPKQEKKLTPSLDESKFFNYCIFDGEMLKDAEYQETRNFQREIFSPVSIATHTLEEDQNAGWDSKSHMILNILLMTNDDNTGTPESKHKLALRIEREYLLFVLDQVLIREKNPTLVNMDVELTIPQKPCDIVVEDTQVCQQTRQTTPIDEYIRRIFKD